MTFITRRSGINATARRPIVCARYGGGRRLNVNAIIGEYLIIENAMPRLRPNDGVSGRLRRQGSIRLRLRKRSNRTARGHAAHQFRRNFVTASGAMKRCLATRAPRRGTAGRIAARPCGESSIANVSGCHAMTTTPSRPFARYLKQRRSNWPKVCLLRPSRLTATVQS